MISVVVPMIGTRHVGLPFGGIVTTAALRSRPDPGCRKAAEHVAAVGASKRGGT